MLKHWCFLTVVLEKALKSLLDCRILKDISTEYSLEGLMLKLKLQYFGHLMRRTDSLEKTVMLGKIEGGGRREWQRMRWLDGITNSMNMSLSNCGSLCLTGRPGVLQSTGSQSARHDWATEVNCGNLESIISLLVPTALRSTCCGGQHTVKFFHVVGVSVSVKHIKAYGSEYYYIPWGGT